MRRLLIITLSALCLLPLSAAERYDHRTHRSKPTQKYNMRYRLSGTAGWLNRDDKIAGDKSTEGFTMDRPVVAGGTFAVEFLPTGRLESLQQWNNASIGLAFTALDLGQQKYLGQTFAPHAYLNIPLVHRPHFVLGLRPGLGLAFVTRTYANTVPADYKWKGYRVPVQQKTETSAETYRQIANVSIGSVVNAFLTGGLYMDFPIRNGWDITFCAAWQHLSNGSVMTPNAGYNMFNAELGLAYTPSESPNGHHFHTPYSHVPKELYDGVTKKWDVEIGVSAGCRSVYYQDQKWFGAGSLSLSAHWIPVSIFRLGAGVDVFYDGAYRSVYEEFQTEDSDAPTTYYGKTYLHESKTANCFRVGISLQPEFIVGNLTFGYHVGIYLYDPIKNLEPFAEVEKNGGPLKRGIFYSYDMQKVSNGQDGWFYQKVQLKYHCSKHIYVQLGLKLHLVKAEFIDAGIGVRI